MPAQTTPKGVAQSICRAVKDWIASGQFIPGAALPSTRSLAAEWGVSRTTVTAAYEQLIAEGYIETRQGGRARVAQGVAGIATRRSALKAKRRPERLSDYGRRVSDFEFPKETGEQRLIADFRYGDLAAEDFPTLSWRKAINAALLCRRDRLRYGDPRGSEDLRSALQGYLWRARGLRCGAEQIVVVNGSQQGLDLCARLLVDAGGGVAIEEPGYYLARLAFEAVGADLIPVAADSDGMRTDQLPVGRLAYTTPSHQFPLGGVMQVARRRELLAWAQRHDAYVIEDDYDSEYRYDIAPIPPLQSLDEHDRVIYLGTISKTLSPTLRLGYLVLPPALVGAFAAAKRIADRHSPGLEQEALANLIASGAYERHVRLIRRRNSERRSHLLSLVSDLLGESVSVVGADAGLHVVVWLRDVPKEQEDAFVTRALAAGVGVYPVSLHYADPTTTPRPDAAGLVIGYARLTDREIDLGVRRLAKVLTEFRDDA